MLGVTAAGSARLTRAGRRAQGIAKTGSGKTAAFVLPMVVHIMDQPELEKGEGPIAVVVSPTRELAEQIHKEARCPTARWCVSCAGAFRAWPPVWQQGALAYCGVPGCQSLPLVAD